MHPSLPIGRADRRSPTHTWPTGPHPWITVGQKVKGSPFPSLFPLPGDPRRPRETPRRPQETAGNHQKRTISECMKKCINPTPQTHDPRSSSDLPRGYPGGHCARPTAWARPTACARRTCHKVHKIHKVPQAPRRFHKVPEGSRPSPDLTRPHQAPPYQTLPDPTTP